MGLPVIIAYIILNRAKSDTSTIKVFADLLTESYKDIVDDAKKHGDESNTMYREMVSTLQTMNALLTKIVNNDDEILKEVKEVQKTGGKIMAKVTPIDQVLKEIRDELQQLRVSVDTHLNSSTQFRDQVKKKTEIIEQRLGVVEKRVTQETPVVESDDSEKQPKEKTNNVRSTKQSSGLDNSSGVDSGNGGSDDGNTGKAVHS